MPKNAYASRVDQLVDRLKQGINNGTWSDTLPGRHQLSSMFAVSDSTVEKAIRQLVSENWLSPQGIGKPRKIVTSGRNNQPRHYHIRILLYDKKDYSDMDNASLLTKLQAAGFRADFASISLISLGMQVDRVARYVEKHPADAWITSAASREVNEWFSLQPFPVLAMYGRGFGLPIAAAFPVMIPSLREATRRLIDLGHQRIVMLAREERRKPKPSRPEQAFLHELEAAGITTGKYNLPDWEENRQGLKQTLNELYLHTPPTALIFQEFPIFMSARLHLANQGILCPRDVSMISMDTNSDYEWSDLSPSHVHWDHLQLINRVVRWAKMVARGKQDIRQAGFKAKFAEGETIGPVPKQK